MYPSTDSFDFFGVADHALTTVAATKNPRLVMREDYLACCAQIAFSTKSEWSLRKHFDRMEPRLHQQRPAGHGKRRPPETVPMNSLRVEMHLDGNVGSLERGVINKRAFDVCHAIIFCLKEESRWCLLSDMDLRIGRQV